MQSAAQQLEPGERFGNYHIVRHIGGGGMAQIYLAKTVGLAGFEKYLALKVINNEYANESRFIQMLIDEAKISVGLAHVNIAQVFDLGQADGIYYIAMEYVDGCDVLELVNRLHALGERLPVASVALIGRQVASGLDYAHSRADDRGRPLDIVHRDISPQNILVSRTGDAKIVDFGIAKAAGVSSKTQAGVIKGKVNYMAPEQAMGHQADRRTDVFAIGIVMWEMLTSQMLYGGNDVGKLVAAVRKAEIAAPSKVRRDVPTELDAIVLKALARRTANRYQTAHELHVALNRFLSSAAPDYGAADLAQLVERVMRPDAPADEPVSHRMSHQDAERVDNRHSLIFQLDGAAGARLILHYEDQQQTIELGDEEVTVGRAGQLVVPDARVSRQHARFCPAGSRYLVEDLGSSNGTYVNSHRIDQPTTLGHGDEIRIGGARLVFFSAEPTTRDAPQPARPKLVITAGEQTTEQAIEADETPLTYQLQIGPVRLQGRSALIIRRKDGFWLEPEEGRLPVKIKSKAITRAQKIEIGDTFEVGGVSFRLTNETKSFASVRVPRLVKSR